MSQADAGASGPSQAGWVAPGRLMRALGSVRPALLFGLRLWVSACLALYIAFWLELDNAYWAGTTAALVCQPSLGASLRKGWFRMIGTVVGAVAIVVLTACFPQDRAAFLASMALWGATCALIATLLRNFAAYAAALAGYTAAIIASDQLGATGGLNGQVFTLAVARTSEICIGIVCAGIVLAGTDLGGAPRRLAALIAALSAEIAAGFTDMLTLSGSALPDTRTVRRELTRRVIALDPVIDEAIGESSRMRQHSPVLLRAVDGLFTAVAGWRTLAVHLERLPPGEARAAAEAALPTLPPELRAAPADGEPSRWLVEPSRLRGACEAARQALIAQPAGTPSLRLVADETVTVLGGVAQALDGLAVLVSDPARSRASRRRVRLPVPDWLPSFVNAVRAFITIGAVSILWIVTGWIDGSVAITFAAIPVILLALRADEAYATAVDLMIGTVLVTAMAATVEFAVLPKLVTFEGFCLALGMAMVPAGALMVLARRKAIFMAMAVFFIPLLAPANQMTYDPQQFYNSALAIVSGIGLAALSFRLMPPLPPRLRTRRLLALTLRDLRRLARRRRLPTLDDWQSLVFSRLSVMPNAAEPLERVQLVAALSVGTEILQLRPAARRFGLDADLDAALAAVAQGNSAAAAARLARLDQAFLLRGADIDASDALGARARVLAMSEALTQHAAYFDAGASG
jgi:uncharacterized membrane protein YccC